jgi:hypothetical protein
LKLSESFVIKTKKTLKNPKRIIFGMDGKNVMILRAFEAKGGRVRPGA